MADDKDVTAALNMLEAIDRHMADETEWATAQMAAVIDKEYMPEAEEAGSTLLHIRGGLVEGLDMSVLKTAVQAMGADVTPKTLMLVVVYYDVSISDKFMDDFRFFMVAEERDDSLDAQYAAFLKALDGKTTGDLFPENDLTRFVIGVMTDGTTLGCARRNNADRAMTPTVVKNVPMLPFQKLMLEALQIE